MPQQLDTGATKASSEVSRQITRSNLPGDRPIYDASALDYLDFALSLITAWTSFLTSKKASFKSKRDALVPFMPPASTLIIFAAFVLLNGGIVLGDKSNHQPTIHLSQMLYIWPLVTFFSFPILVPPVLGCLLPEARLPKCLKPFGNKFHPSLKFSIGFAALSAAVIHFNTIVHPFTLADNRHYMFYVFRILLRHPVIKYLSVFVYSASAWAAWLALAVPYQHAVKSKQAMGQGIPNVFMWVATTVLCLITAPLVEPRYFIMPWIMWRLTVPQHQMDMPATFSASGDITHRRQQSSSFDSGKHIGHVPEAAASTVSMRAKLEKGSCTMTSFHTEYRLWAETIWFLIVNGVTCFVFLHRGYEWPQEPVKLQRFLW